MDLHVEIHGFDSLRHYSWFESQIAALCAKGSLSEVKPDAAYHWGYIYGGRWFLVDRSIWRLVEPDFPFRGLREEVRPKAAPLP